MPRILMAALALALFLVSGPAGAETPIDVPPKISSKDLAAAFQNDEAEADRKYAGRILEVTGLVTENYTMNLADRPYVSLEGGPSGSVRCYLRQKYDLLEKGQPTTIRGKCAGALFDSVSLEDSVIVSP